MESSIGIGLLGCGTVGSGVANALLEGPFSLRRIAVRSIEKPRPVSIPWSLLTRDALGIIDDPDNDVIVECVGGLTDAARFVERALRRGKHVVTANKDLIATQGPRLHALAASTGVTLQYEASVGGAIPIVRTIRESLSSEDIFEVGGVLNGTTNFILSCMHAGSSYADALAVAQRCGYAESDPTSDVSGLDAAHKLAILSQLAFRTAVTTEQIPRRGLEAIGKADVQFAASLGYCLKLLAFARNDGAGYRAGVAPVLVFRAHPFAGPQGVDNCIRVLGKAAGSLIFSGAGAGSIPTASAVISDVGVALRAIIFGQQPQRNTRALTQGSDVGCGMASLGRILRFDSFRDARPAQTLLEHHGYRTHLINVRAALEIFPQPALQDAEILHALRSAQIAPAGILPVWRDTQHPQAPATDVPTSRTHRREKEPVS
ncbi:MAG: homoserine dehydrogenase [Candidatus Eremiobacteraeota bacterium]|nr:homoserine dehydrogenase [Candidatus Eremiobacteraeota bacterium]